MVYPYDLNLACQFITLIGILKKKRVSDQIIIKKIYKFD